MVVADGLEPVELIDSDALVAPVVPVAPVAPVGDAVDPVEPDALVDCANAVVTPSDERMTVSESVTAMR